jgi:hypothetical protein
MVLSSDANRVVERGETLGAAVQPTQTLVLAHGVPSP